MIALVVTTDGRAECIARTIPSLLEHVEPFSMRMIFDDSGDDTYRRWLARQFRPLGFSIVGAGPRVGQDQQLARVFAMLSCLTSTEFVYWCEDDFVHHRSVDLTTWARILGERPYLAQMALVRQPWFPGERRAGGIVERDPEAYDEVRDGDDVWLEHRLWFTLNPCLFPLRICRQPRPLGRRHEWRFSRQLCEDTRVRFGLWGPRGGEPWVEHIGVDRAGSGY